MSEAAEAESKPKGKSKLPIVIVLGLMLGAGGFFGMKMRGGPQKPPPITLSKAPAAELKEFLVNLRDRGVYCRTEISLGLKDGADPKMVEDHLAAVRDAVNLRLTSKSLADVQTLDGLKKLKREIASDVNDVLNKFEEKKEDDKKGDDKGAKDKDPKDSSSKDSKDKDVKAKDPKADGTAGIEHKDWDSDTGPVLKVYFNSFATQ